MTDTTTRPLSARATRIARWLPALACMGGIFALSSMPALDVPGGPAWLGHLLEYTALGAAYTFALLGRRPAVRAAAIAVIAASLYGITDEFHQAFVPGRTPDVVDWGVDTLGAFAGAVLVLALYAKAARRRPSADPL